MTSTEISTQNTTAVASTASTDLVITAEQTEFTSTQVAALKQLGVQDATEGDLQVFFHQAKRTGLDPFARQIYMIGRKTKTGGYRGEPERYETKWTIQTGIDGYRLNGARAAKLQDVKVGLEGPFFRGVDSEWDDVWLGQGPPAAAKYTIIKNGEPITGVAMYTEFVQTNRDGSPNSMWKKMPANQLAKCAEAQAWRKAFPDDFSGVVLEDAAQGQIIDGTVEQPTRTKAPAGRGVAALEALVAKSEELADEPTEEPSDPEPKPEPEQVKAPLKPTKKQADDLDRLFADANLETDNWAARYVVINRTINRAEPVTDIRTLTRDEVADLITTLGSLQTEGVLVETVENMLIEDAQANEAQS